MVAMKHKHADLIHAWAERCKKFDDGEIVTNAKIQQAMQEEIDELREQQAQEIKNRNMDIDALRTFNNDLETEIEALKKELALQKLSDIGQEIENEQVGWLGYHEGHLVSFLQTQEQIESFLENTNTAGRVLPVYTNPQKYCPSENNEAYEKGFIDGMAKQRDSRVQQMVEGYAQLRELTSCEIMEIADEVCRNYKGWGYFQVEFARAILKKAKSV